MKTTILALAALLLAACKKDPKEVTYTATCTGCIIEYVNGSHGWVEDRVTAVERVDLTTRDTTINGTDTTVVDTIINIVPGTWQRTEELAHNEPGRLNIRQGSWATTPSTGSIAVNGATVKSGTVDVAGQTVKLVED